jgi:predicted transcriptional regulator
MSDQPASATVTLRPDLVAELDRVADATGRSRSELAEEALTEYLGVQRAQIEGIEQAIRAADAGEPGVVAYDEVRARVTVRLDAIYGPEPELSDLDPVLRALQARSIPKDGW